MVYTVKRLAKVSGVSVRTLHFYDAMGLLKPAYHGSNGYRFYEEPQLLLLQQILFLRELGLELKQIQKVLSRGGFDKLAALTSHRTLLQKELVRVRRLIKTIDRTIKYMKGQNKMKDAEFFHGFSLVKRGKGTEPYFAAETVVAANLREHGEVDREAVLQTAHDIFEKLVKCLEKGLEPSSSEVQRLIKTHHAFAQQFHVATKEVYSALADLYQLHPEFRKQLDPFHPNSQSLWGRR
jgi:DNA-binding transcriptional MerR regulator